jgi:sulfur transfer protein SufE
MSIQEKYNNYKEQLELLTENMDKYQFLIDLGATKTMPKEFRVETFLVEGLKLTSILSPNRRNGAYNMFGKVKDYAK